MDIIIIMVMIATVFMEIVTAIVILRHCQNRQWILHSS